jgi:transposase-like protein
MQISALAHQMTGSCANDPLHDLLRKGVRELIAKAVEAELSTFLEQYADKTLEDGRRAVVRNGYLPERTVQTGIGDVEVKVPRVRDRSGDGVTFSSALLPPYLKRARSIEELIPWLYLKGVSTGDYQEALAALLAWALLATYQDRAPELVQHARRQKRSTRMSFPFYSLQRGWQRLFAQGQMIFYGLWRGPSGGKGRTRDLFTSAGGLCR